MALRLRHFKLKLPLIALFQAKTWRLLLFPIECQRYLAVIKNGGSWCTLEWKQIQEIRVSRRIILKHITQHKYCWIAGTMSKKMSKSHRLKSRIKTHSCCSLSTLKNRLKSYQFIESIVLNRYGWGTTMTRPWLSSHFLSLILIINTLHSTF